MKRTGNTTSNRKFNPSNTFPDWNRGDANQAMEWFIFKKYDDKHFMDPTSRVDIPSPSSDSDTPPVPPPKPDRHPISNRPPSSSRTTSGSSSASTGKRKPFQSASSSSRSIVGVSIHKATPPLPPVQSKVTRILGDNVNSSDNRMEPRLEVLKQMGFMDEEKNVDVLRRCNGNLQKAVDMLTRQTDSLEENLKQLDISAEPPRSREIASPRGASSQGMNPVPQGGAATSAAVHPPLPPLPQTFNPFFGAASVPAMQQQLLQNQFLLAQRQQQQQQQQQQAQMLAFGQPNMAHQTLFPHRTGNTLVNSGGHNAVYFQTYTPPPIPTTAHFYGGFPAPLTNVNPFFPAQTQPQTQGVAPGPIPVATTTTATAMPATTTTAAFANIAAPQPFQPFSPQFPSQVVFSPFLAQPTGAVQMNGTVGVGGGQPCPQQQFVQPQQPQTASTSEDRAKQLKASIMALYSSYPPTSLQSRPATSQVSVTTEGGADLSTAPSTAPSTDGMNCKRESLNPFASLMTGKNGYAKAPESRSSGLADRADGPSQWKDGRHSPDAFSSLSFRYGA